MNSREIINIDSINLENEIFEEITHELIEYLNVIPFEVNDYVVKVAGVEDELISSLSFFKLYFKKEIDYYVISKKDFENVLFNLKKKQENEFIYKLLKKELNQNESLEPTLMEEKNINYDINSKSNTIIKLVDNIVEKSILMNGSDIHFNASIDEVEIKIRVEGELFTFDKIKIDTYTKVLSRIKVISGMDITKHMVPQDGKFSFFYDNKNYDIRVSIMPTLYGERVTMRILENNSTRYDMKNILMTDVARIGIKNILEEQKGLILVVGSTGSGKTTTLYSLMKEKIKDNVNVISVEDPIEYTIKGANQIQINEETGISYLETLKSALRQDPDVFMIGEIRDKEAAEITIRSALTGHLVFSTIHAKDSISAIYRLIDFGISPSLVVNSLRGIIFQKLVKCICPKCKGSNKEECGNCNNTGEKGRLCIAEVLILNDELKEKILGGNYNEILNCMRKDNSFKNINEMEEIARNEKLIN